MRLSCADTVDAGKGQSILHAPDMNNPQRSRGYSHRSIRRISFAAEGGAVLLRQPVTDAFNRRVVSSLADVNALFQCVADKVLKNQNYAQRQQQ